MNRKSITSSTVLWELPVYPQGLNEGDVSHLQPGKVVSFLHQAGLETCHEQPPAWVQGDYFDPIAGSSAPSASPSLISQVPALHDKGLGLMVVMGGGQGRLRSPVLRQPLGGSTNPFPNLGLVSMGQDVDVRLQGAGFDDHLVPGVGWGGDTAAQPDQSGA